MTPIEISGKPSEVLKQFKELALPEDAQICMTIDELTPEKQGKQENAKMMRNLEAKYAHYPRVNGIIQVSLPGLTTLEEVQEALYRADMEDALGENWEEVLKQMHDANQSTEKVESTAA